jgi:hypothetical protein
VDRRSGSTNTVERQSSIAAAGSQLDRALDILELLAGSSSPRGLADIAQQVRGPERFGALRDWTVEAATAISAALGGPAAPVLAGAPGAG